MIICERTNSKESAIKFLLKRFNFGSDSLKSNLERGGIEEIAFISKEDLWDLVSAVDTNLLQPDSCSFEGGEVGEVEDYYCGLCVGEIAVDD